MTWHAKQPDGNAATDSIRIFHDLLTAKKTIDAWHLDPENPNPDVCPIQYKQSIDRREFDFSEMHFPTFALEADRAFCRAETRAFIHQRAVDPNR